MEKEISVTHFINPQLFWYHKIDVPNEHFHEIIKIEQQLQTLYKDKLSNRQHRPTVKDLIAVCFVSWNKFIRARVENVAKFNAAADAYIVWAVDYGFPFQTKLEHIRRLPEAYIKHIDHIRCGGLVNILPGEKEYDFIEIKPIMSIKDHWNQRACDSLEKLIADAASLIYVEKFDSEGHFWGELKIVNHTGNQFFARDYLIGINMGIDEDRKVFREKCDSLKTTKVHNWLSNDGNNKYKQNILSCSVADRRLNNSHSENTCDDIAKRKVEDWCARNERVGGNVSGVVGLGHMPIESVSNDHSIGTASIDDIGFEDSVSIKHQLLAESCLDLDSVEQEGFVRLGGRLNKSKREIYANGVALQPPAEAFEVGDAKSISDFNQQYAKPDESEVGSSGVPNADVSLPPSITSESISSRKQKLTEMRKKLAAKQAEQLSISSQNEMTIDTTSKVQYEELQESSFDETAIGELQLTNKMRNVSIGEQITASEVSYQSSRAKQLLELRRKRASTSLNITNDLPKNKDDDKSETDSSTCMDKLKKLREKHSYIVDKKDQSDDRDETVSTSSGAPSSYVEYLRNTRRKIKAKSEQTDPEYTLKESSISNKTSSEIENYSTFQLPDSTNKTKKYFPDLKQKSDDPFEGMTVIPAGFDLANLNRYKDEKNHWHRKKTTRYDHIPHDSIFEAEELLLNTSKNTNSSSSSSKNLNAATTEDETHNSISTRGAKAIKKTSMNQNFRHTRAHTDKYKELLEDEYNDNVSNASFVPQTLLDTNIPSLSVDALKPLVNDVSNIDLDNESEVLSSKNYSLNSVGEYLPEQKHVVDISFIKKYKRRQLKSPAEQMNKIHKLLQHAKFEQEQGNRTILDLKYLNQNCVKSNLDLNTKIHLSYNSNSAGVSGNETSENEMSATNNSSSNTRALLEKCNTETKENRQKRINAKLEGLEKQLSDELCLSKKSTLTAGASVNKPIKLSTVIELPQAQQIREITGEKKLQTKFIEHLVLAHSKVTLHPLEKISDAYFLQEIHDEMINMRVTKVYRVQAYAWSHLLRGNSLFVVNPTKSGKTWCYLPPICSLVSYRIQNSALPEQYGPVAIIIVPSSTHVEHVNNYCRRLLINSKSKVTTVPSFGVRNSKDAKIQLLNSCGILVVTPANLLRLLQCDSENEHLIDPARLQHLVIDDLDIILSRSHQDFQNVLRTIFKMVKKSKQSTIPLQVVVTSRDWNAVMQSMIRLCNQPLLLIGDFLEAAVYGKADLSIKLRSQEQKLTTILHFIEKHPQEEDRVLVLCNSDDDMDEVVRSITDAGYACIGYGGISAAEVRVTIEEWKKRSLCFQILVCTDAALPELQIKNANILIHYSMPTSWTKFTSRFGTLAQSYENFVAKDFSRNTSEPKAYSLVLLDEENNKQLPRLIDFMKKHHQCKNIHPDILAVAKRVLVEREESRIFKGTLLCQFFLEFGECDEPRCDYRHNLTRFDIITKGDDIPTSGELRIKILKVFSPTYYTARLLEHKPLNTSKWNIMRRSDKAALFGMQMNMHYMNQENWVIHWPIKINDLCIYKISDTYQRARVLDMPQIKHIDIVQKISVTIKLIDVGTIISGCKSDELLACAKEFKDFPAQAIDIRLIGVVPFDNERSWDSKSTKIVENWIMNDIGKNECVSVDINFSLAKTIWVKNIIVMERLPTVRQYIYRINLKRSLVEKNFGCLLPSNERQSIRDIAEEFGLLTTQDVEDVKENIDHSCDINNDSCNDISNLIKFSSNEDVSLLDVTDEHKNTKQIAPKKNAEKQSDCQEENWDNPPEENKKNEIFVPLSDFNQPTCKSNNRAMRQTKEEWATLPLHTITKVEIGDEMENGNWKDIYMQLVDEFHMQELRELIGIIDCHVEKVKQMPEKKKSFEATWLKPLQNYIVKYDETYCRAKLHGVFGNANDKEIYRFFLCDLACFVTVDAQDLFSDYLYETTQEIVEYTPYQAFHCKLVGISLDEFAKRHPVLKDHLYAYAVLERTELPKALLNFEIHSFEILLYECDKENDLNTGAMLNKSLLEHNIATPHPETKHFLELDNNKTNFTKFGIINVESLKTEFENNENNEGVVSFEELLKIINTSNELDAEAALEDLEDVNEKRKIKKSVIETEAICRATLEQQRKQEDTVVKKLSHIVEREKKHIQDSDDELLYTSFSSASTTTQSVNSLTTDNSSSTKLTAPPPLTLLHKRPKTEWHETDCLIYLVIHAPDINDYYLEVTKDTLTYAAVVNGEEQVLILNFLGTVEPQYVSHEIRGLNVVVRLVKSIFMKWPRLLQQGTKFSWLTYNYNAIDMNGIEKIQPQQRMHLALENSNGGRIGTANKNVDSDTDDDEEGLYTTFTPIINSEDFHDPTADIF